MKKALLFLIITLIVSCTEQFEKMPSDQLPSTSAITTVKDLSLAVNGVYVLFINRASYAGDFGLYADGKVIQDS